MTETQTDKGISTKGKSDLVEMAWDPITRIVGSLGIYTKIDWAAKRVVECHSTSSVFRGYSIFMKGKGPAGAPFNPRPLFGDRRRNPPACPVFGQNKAFGGPPPPPGGWILN